MQRFANLQKLLTLLTDLAKHVTWGIKDKGLIRKGPLKNFAKDRKKKAVQAEKDRIQTELN